MTARAWTNWLLLAVTGIAALAGLIWIGLWLFPLMSWDVYETGRLFIVGILSGLLAVVFGDRRAYAKGKADGYQHGHDVGYQVGWDAHDLASDDRYDQQGRAIHPLGFPHSNQPTSTTHSGSHIYTTE